MTVFAPSNKALGVCDRCGFVYKLDILADQVIDRRRSGLLVCKQCLDIDHEQLQVGKAPISDPQGLRNPRPDNEDGREPLIPYDPPFLNSP